MAGIHSGEPGNPPVEDLETIGQAVAPLITCAGVKPDGSNLEKVFVLTVTDEGMVHMKANMHPMEVVLGLMAMMEKQAMEEQGGMPGMLRAITGGPKANPLSELTSPLTNAEIEELFRKADGDEGS